MAVQADNLEKMVLDNASKSDEIIIISGFFSVDILEKVAKTGIPIKFYYGMYLRNGISAANYAYFSKLEASYPNIKIYIPYVYHVHTKCYIFRKSGITINTLVGSANCSSSALSTTKNSEILMEVVDVTDKAFLDAYSVEINLSSIRYDDPAIVPGASSKVIAVKKASSAKKPSSWHNYSGNPFSAIIPLYKLDKIGNPYIQTGDGLNWGLGPHHSASGTYAEAAIPIRAFTIDNHPTLIPFHGSVGSGTGGKITRRQSPIDVLWDDGRDMKMHFEGNGPERPSPSKRTATAPYRTYPKQLTAASGGTELGEYIRKRLGVGGRTTITYKDLINYGRDYVTFTLTNAGNYEIDFKP